MCTHYHIITCDSEKLLNDFISKKRVGIRPVIAESIDLSVRMNWDILADVARVKKGDYVLLHAKGVIQGVFEVTSDPVVEKEFADLFDGPGINTSLWKKEWNRIKNTIQQNQHVWWLFIQPVKGLFFDKMDMNVFFRKIAEGEIASLPQRLRYEDKNKTVKGITRFDFDKIVKLFYNYSSQLKDSPCNTDFSPGNFQFINFNYLTEDRYEKNLEAVIIYRIRSNKINIENLNFPHENVLNTVPLGYLKMADILTWSETGSGGKLIVVNPWIWELKAGPINNYNELKDEIQKLNSRASYIHRLLVNGYKITGIILAERFSLGVITSFNNVIIPVGLLEEIILISYTGIGENVSFKLVMRK